MIYSPVEPHAHLTPSVSRQAAASSLRREPYLLFPPGGNTNDKPAACRDLRGLHQPGTPRRFAGLCLAHHAYPDERAPVLCGHRDLHHCDGHGGVLTAQRPPDPPPGCRTGDCHLRGHDRPGAAGLFPVQPVLDAAGLRHPLRPGRRQRGCGAKQLCGPALLLPAHVLAALHVGHRRVRGAVHHGLGALRRFHRLAPGLPHGGPDPDRADCADPPEPADVEDPHPHRLRRGGRPRTPPPDEAPADARRPGGAADLLLLLRAGIHRRTVGLLLPVLPSRVGR